MKNELKTAVLAIALTVSVTGVFAKDIANAITGKKLAPYSWQKFNRDGTPSGSAVVSATNPFPECNGQNQVCTVGTDLAEGGNDITLRYPAL